MSIFARNFSFPSLSSWRPNFEFGSRRADVIHGTEGRDKLFGFGGDDTFYGSRGSDMIFGGRGFDTVIYAGSSSDFLLPDLNRGSTSFFALTSGNGSRDRLFGVEALRFEGDDITLYLDGRNNGPQAKDDAVATSENGELSIDVASLLSNDKDFDGDVLTVTDIASTSESGATVTFADGAVIYAPGDVFDTLAVGEIETDRFTYTISDGRGGVATATVEVTINGTNDAPTVSLVEAAEVEENQTFVTTAAIADVDGDTVTVALSGEDADRFIFDSETGAVSFVEAPDFEASTDADGDNVYDVTLTATDENGAATTHDLSVTVTDVDEVPPLEARINELHYDNVGGDTGEFVEVRVAAGGDVSQLQVVLYNGNGGAIYGSSGLSGITPTTDGAYDYYVVEPSSIQNGSRDGIALVNGADVIEFLSYEGTLTATNGPAVGMTSTDMGVEETSSTPIGHSLQRDVDGNWQAPAAETRGETNEVAAPRLNEVHYDNAGADQGEFVEVRVAAGTDVSAMGVVFYNGSNGTTYATEALPGSTMTSDGTYDYYVVEPSSIQNGSRDGIALVNGADVIEFLSYEGTLTATNGPAVGMTSTDMGVAETSGTPIGHSLQRDAVGNWQAPAAETKGGANDANTPPPPPADETLLISTVQGDQTESLLAGRTVTLEAIVTKVASNGFYLMEEASDFDDSAATSEGIFIYTGGSYSAQIADLVSVTGEVAEFFGQTQLSSVSDVTVVTEGYGMPSPVEVFLGPESVGNYEAVEGMLVNVTASGEPLTVIENYNLARFGQVVISSGTQINPTQLYDAQDEQAEIQALAQQNANNRLILDDGVSTQNPFEFQFLPEDGVGNNGNGYLDVRDNFGDDGATVRLGAQIGEEGVTGIMTYGFGQWQLAVTDRIDFVDGTNTDARPDTPADVGGTLQVASYNVLNFFTTIDSTGAGTGPDGTLNPRGADSASEFQRQADKIVDGILGTGAEIIALQEIENNGTTALNALADLLNADPGNTHDWAVIDPTGTGGYVGTDAITTGILYDASAVTPVYSDYLVFDEPSAALTYQRAQVLSDVIGYDIGDYSRNRPSVAATFEDAATGTTFTVVSSHFKSKGDSGLEKLVENAQSYVDGGGTEITQADIDALLNDPNFDQGDGQGFWNAARTDAARELSGWIETAYNGGGVDNVLMLGDLNAYAEEDPTQAMDETYVDLIDTYIGQDEAFSYVFDGQRGTLDHGFADADLAAHVTGAAEWHINASEPGLIGYDESFVDPRFYNDGVFASSDHDPLIVGLDFSDPFIA